MDSTYNDWIQGDKFRFLSSDKIFFCRTEHTNSFFKRCDRTNPFILVTHCGDGYITDNPRDVNTMQSHHHADVRLIPPNLHKWYGSMVEYQSDKIIPLPIGVENDVDFHNKKQSLINEKNSPVKKYNDKLLYVNFKISNNYIERISAYNAVKNTDFCTIIEKTFTPEQLNPPDKPFPYVYKEPFDVFIREIHMHHFVLCPVGNGMDSHRLWETLYVGSIPIIRRNVNYAFYEDKLPILFVDEWDEITKDFLLQKKDEIGEKLAKGFYNMEILNFSYWKDMILSELDKI